MKFKTLQAFFQNNKSKALVLLRILSFLMIINLLKDIPNGKAPSPDIIATSFILIAVVINRGRRFIIDWLPIIVFFYIYEVIRGHAFLVQSYFNIPVHKTILLEWERYIFGDNIPTLIFQRFIYPEPTVLDYISMIMYTSFFWGAFITGFILWLKSKKLFLSFRNAYIFLCYAGALTYIFFPAYPPWLASQEGYLPPLHTDTWGRLEIGASTLGFFKNAGYNPVAPMPSLHTGWSVLCAIMLDSYFKKKIGFFSKLFYLYPLGMFFVIIYTSDHYVVDIIGGILYAVVAAIFGFKSHNLFKRLKVFFKQKTMYWNRADSEYEFNYKPSRRTNREE